MIRIKRNAGLLFFEIKVYGYKYFAFASAVQRGIRVTSTTLLANWEKGFNRAVFNRDKKPA